jgi:hypothetical protein
VGDAYRSGAFQWPQRTAAGSLDFQIADANERQHMAESTGSRLRLEAAPRIAGSAREAARTALF